MSTQATTPPQTPPAAPDDIPVPRHFVVSPVKETNGKNLPKLTAVYLHCDKWPSGILMENLTGVSLDRDPDEPSKMHLALFAPAPDDDLQEGDTVVFTDTAAFTLTAPPDVIHSFWDNIAKIKTFILAVSTEEYYFEAKVNFDSTEVTQMTCEYRHLN